MRSSNVTKKHSSKPSGCQKREPLFGRADQRRLRAGTQMRGRMVRKRQYAGTPAGPAQAQGLARDLTVAAMKPVEETDRERERTRPCRATSS